MRKLTNNLLSENPEVIYYEDNVVRRQGGGDIAITTRLSKELPTRSAQGLPVGTWGVFFFRWGVPLRLTYVSPLSFLAVSNHKIFRDAIVMFTGNVQLNSN